ncbi:MAG: energy transducer TonB [Bacteroidia bacterium]|nr:energy transducer TonB [Bacteroidia bacterium]
MRTCMPLFSKANWKVFIVCPSILLYNCSSPDAEKKGVGEDRSSSSSVVEQVSDSLASEDSASLSISSKGTASPSPPPPPKKEAWMDTLLDLTGIPAPNSAILIEEDPVPRNLSSVEILISQRFRPSAPVSLTLRLYVTEMGTVRRVQLLKSSDPRLTPAYFIPPLLELRFSPALYNGKAISAWTTQTFHIKPYL